MTSLPTDQTSHAQPPEGQTSQGQAPTTELPDWLRAPAEGRDAGGGTPRGGSPAEHAVAPPPRSPWRRRVAAGALAVLLAVGGGVTGAWIADRDQPAAATGPVVATGSSGSGESATSNAEQVAQALQDVVVDVSVSGFGGTGTGSGVIMRSDGYILTNNHVVDGAQSVTVTLNNGDRLEADVVGTNATTDIAVLKVDRDDLPVATFATSADVRVGEPVIAVGSPFGLSGTVTTGIVSALDRVITASSGQGGQAEQIVGAIQTDAAINPGNSGGALANASGEVIGINTAIAGGSGGNNGVGFAIPSDTGLDVAEHLINGTEAEIPYVGVGGGQDVTQQQAAQYGIGDRTGALIQQVEPGGPAADAGIQVGDLVVQVDGTPVHNWDEFVVAFRKISVGEDVPVKVVRDGQTQTLTVTPTARPSS